MDEAVSEAACSGVEVTVAGLEEDIPDAVISGSCAGHPDAARGDGIAAGIGFAVRCGAVGVNLLQRCRVISKHPAMIGPAISVGSERDIDRVARAKQRE